MGRAITLAQLDRDRTGEVADKAVEIGGVGPAKAVDGLVRVADDTRRHWPYPLAKTRSSWYCAGLTS